jgi:cardiolipin synthase
VLNPANLLTIIRVAITPFLALALMGNDCRRAIILLVFAAATDAIDGPLARRFRWESRLGAYLDPIADKFLLTTVYICFGISGLTPAWLVWLIIGRDLLILCIAAVALLFTKFREFPPSIWGKLSTIAQSATGVATLATCAPAHPVLIWTTAAITLWSGIHYTIRGLSAGFGSIRQS